MASFAHTLGREVFVGCEKPQKPFIKLNVDGAARGNPGLAGVAAASRDQDGRWSKGAV